MVRPLTLTERQQMLADLLANPDAENLAAAQGIVGQLAEPQPKPQNYLQRSGGPVIDLGPSQPVGPALDYTSGPVEMPGMGRGYRLKTDPLTVMMPGGQRLSMGRDQEADRKAEMEQLKLQKARNEVAGSGRQSAYDVALEKALAEAKTTGLLASIPGTPQHKKVQEEERAKVKQQALTQKGLDAAKASQRYAEENATMLETSIADILGVKPTELEGVLGTDTKAAQKRVAPAVGVIDAMTPTFFQNTRNIQSATENLKSKAQLFGLANLRKAGIAPGSITEKEWPKFEAALANIDPSLGEAQFVKQLQDVYRQVKAARQSGQLDYEALAPEAMQQVEGVAQVNPSALMQQAQEAISRGAPRDAVMRRLQQQLGGR